VKRFLALVIGGALAFVVIAVVQERDVFLAAVTGTPPAAAAGSSLDPAEREAAAQTVRTYLSLLTHFYRSNGDPRFVERMPASPEVVDELRRDVAYLRHNHRTQEPQLARLDVVEVTPLGPDDLEVETREYWIVPIHIDGSKDPPDQRSSVVPARYRLTRDPLGWSVAAWDLVHAEEPAP